MSAATQPHTDERIARLRLQRVMHDFGALLAVTAIDDHSFKVSTPFSFGNGDMYPIVFESHGTRWRITDRGGTIANLTRTHGELTHAHIDTITAIAQSSGFTISQAHAITADFDDLPTPRDIADLIQLETRISDLLRTTP
jgi:Domain of unknown function DUF1828